MTIGELIRDRRLKLGASQEQVASRLNLDQTLISKVENGRYEFPVAYSRVLADCLQVDFSEIVEAILETKNIKFQSIEEAAARFEELLGLDRLYETTDIVSRSKVLRKTRSELPFGARQEGSRTKIPLVGVIGSEGSELPIDDSGRSLALNPETLDLGEVFAPHKPLLALRLRGKHFEPRFEDGTRLIVGGTPYFEGDVVLMKIGNKCYLGILGSDEGAITLSFHGKKNVYRFSRGQIVFILKVTGGIPPTEMS